MSGRKNVLTTVGLVLSVSLIAAVIAVLLTSVYYSRFQFDTINEICGVMLRQEPESEELISAALKECINRNVSDVLRCNILSEWGYGITDFSYMHPLYFAVIGFLAGTFLFVITFLFRNRTETLRIRALADYLERVNTGKAEILSVSGEDDFSKLEDEIYKTVTFLYQTKDKAVQVKNDFAENLYNIAHQIKTPITAISLSLQTMEKEMEQSEKIQKQLLRLTRLEEGLLLLSRFDAGTLVLQKSEIDVLTVIVLAADNLQELLAESGASIDIPELGEMAITADLEWTMEALINLMKNCMEHNRGGTVHCSYGQNPLYTEILIWDEGNGFDKEDIPHLFERFYRGKNACAGGIGIGLALAKEIIERQNGTIHAKNMPDGGACFEIRFYCH
ncbi:sensor histidine kinase [Lachnotalea sp. AF33-28]|jgi:signal transduction histidine kinase|uniref:sensor histidine kinase n=1 Tax=Lachnotalea sp. AF33-28 TaxID=2292046 RepID=UPI000E523E9C|nr:HAMP domain-containing sensor histidine kinase [Lachnotalea sp. AF33-28]RHP28988.1 sensor histidine kinase [Lachnotalea sp. AF33-28]